MDEGFARDQGETIRALAVGGAGHQGQGLALDQVDDVLAATVQQALDFFAGEVGLVVLDGGQDGLHGYVGSDGAGLVMRGMGGMGVMGDTGRKHSQFAALAGRALDVERHQLAFIDQGADFVFGEVEEALGGLDGAEGTLVTWVAEEGQTELRGAWSVERRGGHRRGRYRMMRASMVRRCASVKGRG